MQALVQKHLKTLQNLKVAQQFLTDIFKLEQAYSNFSFDTSAQTLSDIILKYQKELNFFGKNLTNIFATKSDISPVNYYSKEKKKQDILNDIEYVYNHLILIIAVKCGLEPDYSTVVEKLKKLR